MEFNVRDLMNHWGSPQPMSNRGWWMLIRPPSPLRQDDCEVCIPLRLPELPSRIVLWLPIGETCLETILWELGNTILSSILPLSVYFPFTYQSCWHLLRIKCSHLELCPRVSFWGNPCKSVGTRTGFRKAILRMEF